MATVILADHITLDGDTAWTLLVELAQYCRAGEFPQLLDRPCDLCSGQTRYESDGYVCPARCIDGRHTFNIEVECPHLPEDHTFHVSVVPGMVLPIVDNDALEWYGRHDHHIGMGADEHAEYSGRSERGGEPQFVRNITLPTAAGPDMWAVKLRVAS